MARTQTTRLRAAAATAFLSLALAAPALAGHDDWERGRDWRGYPVHRHDRSCDRDGWAHNDHRGHYGPRGYYRERGHRHRDSYGCRPCGRRWSGRDAFHRHLARSHRVPYWAIPRVVVEVDWGWMFRG